MKREAQAIAVELLRRHPGWSDGKVGRELEKRKIPAASSSVHMWRVDAGLAPATGRVDRYPPPRVAGVWLECGHLIHPENLLDPQTRLGHCNYCGGDFLIAR